MYTHGIFDSSTLKPGSFVLHKNIHRILRAIYEIGEYTINRRNLLTKLYNRWCDKTAATIVEIDIQQRVSSLRYTNASYLEIRMINIVLLRRSFDRI